VKLAVNVCSNQYVEIPVAVMEIWFVHFHQVVPLSAINLINTVGVHRGNVGEVCQNRENWFRHLKMWAVKRSSLVYSTVLYYVSSSVKCKPRNADVDNTARR